MGEGFLVAVLVTTLKADDDFEILLVSDFGHFENLAHAGSIDSDGFFHEDVFASVHSGLEMIRTEAGRCGEDDEVAAFDDFLVSIWTQRQSSKFSPS